MEKQGALGKGTCPGKGLCKGTQAAQPGRVLGRNRVDAGAPGSFMMRGAVGGKGKRCLIDPVNIDC